MLRTHSYSNKLYIPCISLLLTNSHINVCIYPLVEYYSIYIFSISKKLDIFNKITTWHFYLNSRRYLFTKFLTIFWHRVVFKGKGFRVRVRREDSRITLNFGYSHWTKLKFLENWDFFKLYRQNYIIFTSNLYDSQNFCLLVSRIKVMNRYTLRGLRLKKQPIKRRFGKISQYVSSLH